MGQRAKIGVIAVCFSMALAYTLSNLLGGGGAYESRNVERVWMKDLASGELFDAGVQKAVHPPITTDSGGQAVKAHVFACGDCNDESKQFIAYLEKYLPEAHEMFASGRRDLNILAKTHVVRADDEDRWVPIGSPEGVAIIKKRNERCGTQTLVPCFPTTP